MSLFKLDDHYNQSRYKWEWRHGSIIQLLEISERGWWPFIFNREAKSTFWYNTQLGHRSKWLKENIRWN